jgi:hypothetical protein
VILASVKTPRGIFSCYYRVACGILCSGHILLVCAMPGQLAVLCSQCLGLHSEQSRAPNVSLRFLGFISPFSHFPVLADFQRAAQQQEDQEQKDEESEEKALHRMREWDDWKDTHPRGYGNRQNMG